MVRLCPPLKDPDQIEHLLRRPSHATSDPLGRHAPLGRSAPLGRHAPPGPSPSVAQPRCYAVHAQQQGTLHVAVAVAVAVAVVSGAATLGCANAAK